jgi:hypothetical protein
MIGEDEKNIVFHVKHNNVQSRDAKQKKVWKSITTEQIKNKYMSK